MTFFHEINVWAYIHISTKKSSQKFDKYFIFKMWVYFMKKYFFILFSVGILYEKSNFAYNNILIIKNPTKIILSSSILNHISITENQ